MQFLAANKKLLLAKSGIKSMVLASNKFLLLAKTFLLKILRGLYFT
jgi:hypothetical protein